MSISSTITPAMTGTSSPATPSFDGESVESSTPTSTVPLVGVLANIAARRTALEQEIAQLKEAEVNATAQEAAAKRDRLTALVNELPRQFEVKSLGEVLTLIRSVQGSIYAARRGANATTSRPARRKGDLIPTDTKALALLAIIEGIKERAFVERFHISSASFHVWRRKLRAEGKLTGASTSSAPRAKRATKAKASVRRGSQTSLGSKTRGKVKLNSRGRVLHVVAPYPAEKKASIIKRLVKGEGVTALHRETGVSRSGLAIWKKNGLKAAA